MKKKPGVGWVYALIILCLLFSAVMAYGLLRKLDDQQQSADAYAQLSKEVIVTGAADFNEATAEPQTTDFQTEEEAEDQSDTVFFLEHDIHTMAPEATATPEPTATPEITAVPVTPTPTPDITALAASPTPAQSAGLTATPRQTQSGVTLPPIATVTPTVTAGAPTASTGGWTVIQSYDTIPPAQSTNVETPLPEVTATPQSAVTATPQSALPTNTPAMPTATSVPAQTVEPAVTPTGSALMPTLTPTATPAPTEAPRQNLVVTEDEVRYSVDFNYLQSLNADMRGWLIQPDTVINYPVMQGEDNDEYLDKLFNGKQNKDGSLFLDSGNGPLFTDANNYIYGHHTKTDAMFSTLAEYKDQAYYEAHPQMFLLTPNGDYQIDLFASLVCAVDDETSWRVKQFTRKSEFEDYLIGLEGQSLIQGNEDVMPAWGDQLLVLVTCTNEQHGERYVVYGRMRQIVYANPESISVTKMEMDAKPTLGGYQQVPGRGEMMVYAQNDPIWNDMRYESRRSSKNRTFGAGGCGPTSVAMAIVNLVPKERLSDIFGYASSSLGYSFGASTVNQYHTSKTDSQYFIQTTEEYLRYYPLVMAGFATGNNLWGQESRSEQGGTTLNFLKKVSYLYKLSLSYTYDNDEAVATVRGGGIVIASLGKGNPFTGGGHYIVLGSVDDQYAYFLDPFRKENYDKTDRKHLLTMIAPGVVRVALTDLREVGMSTCYLLNTTDMTASAEPPAAE